MANTDVSYDVLQEYVVNFELIIAQSSSPRKALIWRPRVDKFVVQTKDGEKFLENPASLKEAVKVYNEITK